MINVQQLRGGSSTASAYAGPIGELVVDTDLWALRIQDGVTPGGHLINPAGANLSISDVGNTTGVTSSSTQSHGLTMSFAGGISGGFSLGSMIFSGNTIGEVLNVVAEGLTTAATSSATLDPRSISLSFNGDISGGFDTNHVLQLSVPPGAGFTTSKNQFAIGNTTGLTSSATVTLTQQTFSGAGGVSIGFSTTGTGDEVIIISGNTGGGAGTLSFFEPTPLHQAGAAVQIFAGSMSLAPLVLPAPISFDQARMLISRAANIGATLSINSSTNSNLASASASCVVINTVALFSRQTGVNSGTFTSISSSIVSGGMSDSWGISQSSASVTASITRTYIWNSGTGTSSLSVSGTTSTSNATAFAPVVHNVVTSLSSRFFASAFRYDIPWAGTLPSGEFAFGMMGTSTGVGGTTGAILPALPGTALFQQSYFTITASAAGIGLMGIGAQWSQYAIGLTSSVGSVVPVTFPVEGLSQQGGWGAFPYFQLGQL